MKFQKLFLTAGVAIAGICGMTNAYCSEVARVNDQPISDKDLRFALTLSGLNEGQSEGVLKDANSRRQILNSLIDQEVLVSQAKKDKLDQDAEFKEATEAFKKQFLSSRVLQKNLGSKVTDAAVKKYYEAHKSRYSTDQVHAMHILVSDESRAQEVLKLAKAKNADFQQLAEKYSKDPSAKNNRGDLGFFGRDRMVPEFTSAAFAGEDGQVVGPVKTTYGYHIIKVVEHKTGQTMSFDDVELRVRNDMMQDVREEYVNKLRKQAKITVQDTALDKL
jgi:peptidyl-prolyl cis-trans isomerase C